MIFLFDRTSGATEIVLLFDFGTSKTCFYFLWIRQTLLERQHYGMCVFVFNSIVSLLQLKLSNQKKVFTLQAESSGNRGKGCC